MGKSADLACVIMGIWRAGAVHVPLFTAFAPPAIGLRLGGSEAKFVVSDADQVTQLAPGEALPDNPAWPVLVAGVVSSTAARTLTIVIPQARKQAGVGNALTGPVLPRTQRQRK